MLVGQPLGGGIQLIDSKEPIVVWDSRQDVIDHRFSFMFEQV